MSRVVRLRFNTASGKHCCNRVAFEHKGYIIYVSIPQAVSTVATINNRFHINFPPYVSIPQAVSTVATKNIELQHGSKNDSFNTASGKHCCNSVTAYIRFYKPYGFNTASGKHCCNINYRQNSDTNLPVSIPQAVSTVATKESKFWGKVVIVQFQYRKR